ncbi:hypothetical protein [Pseudomonas protegens]|uniref:hypothetical protein n=1 Tax=Pseudomonas protegens TaxID=380021 RepID=UPI0035B51B09
MMHAPRTAAQAKEWIESQGKSIMDFASENGLDLHTTYRVLACKKKNAEVKFNEKGNRFIFSACANRKLINLYPLFPTRSLYFGLLFTSRCSAKAL